MSAQQKQVGPEELIPMMLKAKTVVLIQTALRAGRYEDVAEAIAEVNAQVQAFALQQDPPPVPPVQQTVTDIKGRKR
jgi:hypothetical protein